MSTSMANYVSSSQNIRIITESFVARNGFCPSCGSVLRQAPNNSKAKDFECTICSEEFELKAKGTKIGKKIVNGAYQSLCERVVGQNNPNLYVLQYSKNDFSIENFMIIPRYFFVPEIIERRKPLSSSARRAGWVGCNILVSRVPEIGKIHYIRNRQSLKKQEVLEAWQKTTFLKEDTNITSRSWLLDTLSCIERTSERDFSLTDIYSFESELKLKHPKNNFIKDKLRQQLQILRDKNIIEFLGNGKYRKLPL